MNERLDKLRRRFRSLHVVNFLVTRLSNIRYLCGFTGSNAVLLVTDRDAFFISDGRYTNQAADEVKNAKTFTYSSGATAAECFVNELKNNPEIKLLGRTGIESQHLTVEFYTTLSSAFPNVSFRESINTVENIAACKSEAEINAIERAVKITDQVFSSILSEIKQGVTELDLSTELTCRQKQLGAEKDAFEAIVASGWRSALPHGIASKKKLKSGELITFDFGCVVDGYASDMTRTVVLGKATQKQREVYGVVQEAQRLAAEAVKAGTRCADVDAVARKVITRAGYGDKFTHGLGHGLGLEVHARPVLSKVSKDKLAAGMVVTVEPGIYIDGFGGVRIEDDVVVNDNGAKILNTSPRELIEL